MPRIKAALALLATAVFCIGFNVVRYPVVWQMVAASPPAESEKLGPLAGSPAAKPGAKRLAAPAAAIRGGEPDTAASDGDSDSRPSKPAEEAATRRYGLKAYEAGESETLKSDDSREESTSWPDRSADSLSDASTGSHADRSTGGSDDRPGASRSERGSPLGSGSSSSSESSDAAPKKQSATAKSAARSDGKKAQPRPAASSGVAAKKPAGGGKTADRSRAKKKSEPSEPKKPWEKGDLGPKPTCTGDVCALPGSAASEKSSAGYSETGKGTSDASENAWGKSSGEAVEATPGPAYGSATDSARSWSAGESSTRPDNPPAMVPVVGSAGPSETTLPGVPEYTGSGRRDELGNASALGSSHDSSGSASTSVPQVRRLPPVDHTASTEPESTALFDTSVPVYPTTRAK